MSMYRKLTTAAAVAALAFGLAACGGGGGGDDTADTPTTMEPMPMPPPTAAVTIPDGMYLNEDNAPSAGMMTIAAGESATNNGVIFSCPAGGDACEVEVAADGSVTSTGGEATAALSDDAMVQVAQAKQDAADAAMMAMQERRDRVIGFDRALEAAAGLADGTTAGTLDENDIGITRGPSAMARVRVADPAGFAAVPNAALPNGNWHGTELRRSVQTPAGVQYLTVYTDIELPTRIQFYNFDNDAMTQSLYDTALSPAATPVTTDATTDYVNAMPALTLPDADGLFSATTADPAHFPAPRPPEEGDFTQRYPNNTDSDPNTAGLESYSVPGNFNGAGGRYTCTGGTADNPCSVTVTPAGAYTTSGTWSFVPELNARPWLGDQEFMSFGWWMQEPTAQTGAYTFRYYADGTPYDNTPDGGAALTLRPGSATYTGRAAGSYVIQDIEDEGVVDGRAGRFVAAASLTARFGTTNTIEGAISGFQGDHEMASGWAVTLNRQPITIDTDAVTSAGTQNDPAASGFHGATATHGDLTLHGTWSSQFFGQPRGNAYPLGVGGVFQADNESASIAGAFGARR